MRIQNEAINIVKDNFNDHRIREYVRLYVGENYNRILDNSNLMEITNRVIQKGFNYEMVKSGLADRDIDGYLYLLEEDYKNAEEFLNNKYSAILSREEMTGLLHYLLVTRKNRVSKVVDGSCEKEIERYIRVVKNQHNSIYREGEKRAKFPPEITIKSINKKTVAVCLSAVVAISGLYSIGKAVKRGIDVNNVEGNLYTIASESQYGNHGEIVNDHIYRTDDNASYWRDTNGIANNIIVGINNCKGIEAEAVDMYFAYVLSEMKYYTEEMKEIAIKDMNAIYTSVKNNYSKTQLAAVFEGKESFLDYAASRVYADGISEEEQAIISKCNKRGYNNITERIDDSKEKDYITKLLSMYKTLGTDKMIEHQRIINEIEEGLGFGGTTK